MNESALVDELLMYYGQDPAWLLMEEFRLVKLANEMVETVGDILDLPEGADLPYPKDSAVKRWARNYTKTMDRHFKLAMADFADVLLDGEEIPRSKYARVKKELVKDLYEILHPDVFFADNEDDSLSALKNSLKMIDDSRPEYDLLDNDPAILRWVREETDRIEQMIRDAVTAFVNLLPI